MQKFPDTGSRPGMENVKYLRWGAGIQIILFLSLPALEIDHQRCNVGGETPEIRLAWPRLAGRMSLSFCRASSRRQDTCR